MSKSYVVNIEHGVQEPFTGRWSHLVRSKAIYITAANRDEAKRFILSQYGPAIHNGPKGRQFRRLVVKLVPEHVVMESLGQPRLL